MYPDKQPEKSPSLMTVRGCASELMDHAEALERILNNISECMQPLCASMSGHGSLNLTRLVTELHMVMPKLSDVHVFAMKAEMLRDQAHELITAELARMPGAPGAPGNHAMLTARPLTAAARREVHHA